MNPPADDRRAGAPRGSALLRRVRADGASALERLARRLTPPPDAAALRRKVGGLWDHMGELQIGYMREAGLRPEHRFLDVGCGVLRAGRHFVRYLEPGHYYGIDLSPHMIDGAREQLQADGLADRDAHLRVTDEFDVDFGVAIDFAIAQSVFTHLPLNSIWRALARVGAVLAPDGEFHATFFRSPDGVERLDPIVQPAHPDRVPVTTFSDKNPYHYSPRDFERLCENLPLRVTDIGDWGHPRGQQMLVFRRDGA